MPGRRCRRFLNRYDAVSTHVAQRLPHAAGPLDLDSFRSRKRSQAKVDAAGTRRCIADAGGHVVVLRSGWGSNSHPRANGHAVALGSAELQLDPMVLVRTYVVKHFELPIQSRGNDVEQAVIVQIADSGA